MKEYVLGFAFNEFNQVLLIKKNRPEWQAGNYNGIGGKIEANELPIDAMVREFMEETGVITTSWVKYADMTFGTCVVHVFKCFDPETANCKTITDEEIEWIDINEYYKLSNIIENLCYLIPLGLSGEYRMIHFIE